jgi:hypothetical protein
MIRCMIVMINVTANASRDSMLLDQFNRNLIYFTPRKTSYFIFINHDCSALSEEREERASERKRVREKKMLDLELKNLHFSFFFHNGVSLELPTDQLNIFLLLRFSFSIRYFFHLFNTLLKQFHFHFAQCSVTSAAALLKQQLFLAQKIKRTV